MKIVFILRYFYPHVGGVEKHCLRISEELTRRGNDVSIITSQSSLPSAKNKGKGRKDVVFKKLGDIKIYYLNSGEVNKQEKFRVWKKILKLKDVIEQADVVHCHDIFYWYLPFRAIYPTRKVFTTFHGYEENGLPSKKAVVMHNMAEKLSKGNICIGDYLKKWYKTKPTFVSYGATDVKKAALALKNNKKGMFLGRVEKATGIMVYLNALRLLKDKKIDIKLDVFGDGKMIQKAKAFAKIYKLNVSFKGFVEDAEKYIKNYEIVFTSGYLGILEALSRKRYVFSVYEDKIKKDYLTQTPFSKFISISKDSKKLKEELKKYFKNKTISKKKINQGYEWVKSNNWKKLTDLYLKLWSI